MTRQGATPRRAIRRLPLITTASPGASSNPPVPSRDRPATRTRVENRDGGRISGLRQRSRRRLADHVDLAASVADCRLHAPHPRDRHALGRAEAGVDTRVVEERELGAGGFPRRGRRGHSIAALGARPDGAGHRSDGAARSARRCLDLRGPVAPDQQLQHGYKYEVDEGEDHRAMLPEPGRGWRSGRTRVFARSSSKAAASGATLHMPRPSPSGSDVGVRAATPVRKAAVALRGVSVGRR
jgi:hypothetical protein